MEGRELLSHLFYRLRDIVRRVRHSRVSSNAQYLYIQDSSAERERYDRART